MRGVGFALTRRTWLLHCSLSLGLAAAAGHCAARAAQAGAAGGPVLVLGDSLSAEYGLPRGSGWVALLEERLAGRKPAVAVVNASVSGDTTSGGLSRLPPLLEQHRPAVLVIELGGNDALRGLPLDMTRSNLAAMARLGKAAGARVLVVGMQVPPNYGRKYAQQFSALFQAVAKTEGAALVPFLLAGVADVPAAESLFQPDRIHPNRQAQALMLDNVWPALEALLR